MMENQKTKDRTILLNEFSYYLVDFFMSVIIGLGIVILLNIPLKFIRVINMDLCAFIVHLLSMGIVLYMRSYRRGYHTNTKTYTFDSKKAILFVGIVFAIQIVLIFVIGGHAVYITGPTYWFTTYLFPTIDLTAAEGREMVAGYNWLFVLIADVFIYAPIMVVSEYWGDKQNKKELSETEGI